MSVESHHPDLETLFRYRDGVLPENEGSAVRAHLAACSACRGEMDRIARALTALPGDQTAPPVADLLASLSELQSAMAQAGASGDALIRRVASELIPYVGTTVAERILQLVTPDGENLLSTVESALRVFLGKAATARVVSRIVDRAIMRT